MKGYDRIKFTRACELAGLALRQATLGACNANALEAQPNWGSGQIESVAPFRGSFPQCMRVWMRVCQSNGTWSVRAVKDNCDHSSKHVPDVIWSTIKLNGKYTSWAWVEGWAREIKDRVKYAIEILQTPSSSGTFWPPSSLVLSRANFARRVCQNFNWLVTFNWRACWLKWLGRCNALFQRANVNKCY